MTVKFWFACKLRIEFAMNMDTLDIPIKAFIGPYDNFLLFKARSHALSTERTILSPFTKEYRVLVAESGIRLFLEGLFFGKGPKV
ncbi:hypothetical protein GQ457_04G008420 [Hibiscus cannabinus]